MSNAPTAQQQNPRDAHRLLIYVADLELEVDRLRKQIHLIRHESSLGLKRILAACADTDAAKHNPAEVTAAAQELSATLRDLREPPGYHPSHDQVIAVAIRPLAEQVFRWQQRLTGNREVELRLDLQIDYVEWFPARLRHILDNLMSNALRYRDPVKAEAWVFLGLRESGGGYEFRLSDNGMGMSEGNGQGAFELLSRAAPVREAGLGVGLPVARLLVEQSGGSLTVNSEGGRGTDFVLFLPRYDIDDFLT